MSTPYEKWDMIIAGVRGRFIKYSSCGLVCFYDVLEVEVFEREVDFDYSCGLDPGPQDVLLGRLVLFGAQALEVVEETGERRRDW